MSEWSQRTLGEVVDRSGGLVQTGPFGSKLHRADYTDGDGVPLVMPKDMVGGRIDYVSAAKVNLTKAAEMQRHACGPFDVLLARRGDIGRCAFVRPADAGVLCGTGSIRISVQRTEIDPAFLFYFLSSETGRAELEARAVGATMANLSATAVRQVMVPVPPLSIQRKIASILSAHEDFIETNRRRIRLLDEVVQRIYREWFVYLRYPGHPQSGSVDALPPGWTSERIGDLIETVGGGTPARKEPTYWEGGDIAWYTPSDLTTAKSVFMRKSKTAITSSGLARSAARLFPAGSVMMTSRATIGVVAIADTEACTNQGFITCIPNEAVSTYYLYFWLRDNRDLIDTLASGATFKEISRSEFRDLTILVPPLLLQQRFVEMARPLFDLIRNLEAALGCARELHDRLLPRLISGQIDLDELDIAAEEAAA